MQNIPYQMEFRPELSINYGSKDYHDTCDLLIKIDEILVATDFEAKLIAPIIEKMATEMESPEAFLSSKYVDRQYAKLKHALRCNIARHLMNDTYRDFSFKLSDSQLLQWFTCLNSFSGRRATSKSALERYEKLFDIDYVTASIGSWLSTFSERSVAASIGLSEAIRFSDIWADSTCIDANIHFPVDWVLLRDAVRSLLLCIRIMRKSGLKHRMMNPDLFQKRMNKLCIEMTNTRRKTDGKKQRKKILRKMKKLSQTIRKHVERYRELFTFQWEALGFSEAESNQMFARMDNILTQLPKAIHQAHERIIGERQIPSKEKIISLYDHDAEIIVRGKAGSEVEFGQKLLLVEQRNGLIVDWELQGKNSDMDGQILKRSVQRIQSCYGSLESVSGDRAFNTKANDKFLQSENIFNGTCPKHPEKLKDKLKDPVFAELQQRRSATEGRIAIAKNVFIGKPIRSRILMNKRHIINWCVLSHNLWILARMALADEQELKQAA